MRHAILVGLVVLAAVACGSSPRGDLPVQPLGPPDVRLDVVRDHARALDGELPNRVAGTQQDLAASAYVLGHLQRAGYVVELEYVPVKDLVRATNLVAAPPAGGEPRAIVVVGYDQGTTGEAIGLFLEVARALAVRSPDHTVGFVALAAESIDLRGGRLGARRLVQQLFDRGIDPAVVRIADRLGGGAVTAEGPLADHIAAAVPDVSVGGDRGDRVFAEARLSNAVVSGPPGDVGEALLLYLAAVGD